MKIIFNLFNKDYLYLEAFQLVTEKIISSWLMVTGNTQTI